MKKHAVSHKTLARLLRCLRPSAGLILLSLFCAVLTVLAALLIPVFSGQAIDAMLGIGQVDFQVIGRTLMWIGLTVLVSSGAQYLMAQCNHRITYSVSYMLREEAISKIQRLPLSVLDRHKTGDLVSRIITDVDTITDGLLMGFTQFFTGVLTILGILIVMFRLNWMISLLVVALTPLSIFVAGLIVKKTSRYFHEQSIVRGRETALVNERIDGQKVVQAFGHEAQSLKDFDAVNEELGSVSLKATFFSSLTNPSTRMVNNIVYAAVGLVGALSAIAGDLSVGALSVFLSYAGQYAKPFNEISGVVSEMENALACAGRLFEFLDEQEDISEQDRLEQFHARGDVDIEHLHFSYDRARPLIEDFHLSVHAGDRIAIVGPTGCGKTTLINLLMRFYEPDAGRILVDDTPVTELARQTLRKNYGMVLQDTWLMAGSIRENIAFGRPEASMEEVEQAARSAHIDGFISRLPEGYDTPVQENGGNMSAGQKQLLCIARVMLCLPPMLILDEATSALDTESERLVQQALERLMKTRTTVAIAHRLSTIKTADEICVIHEGRIVERGTHDELLRMDGYYKKLNDMQSL